eukprot:245935_1
MQQSFILPESTMPLFQFPSLAQMQYVPSISLANPILPLKLPENSQFSIPPLAIDHICNASNDDLSAHNDSIRSQIEVESHYLAEKKQVLVKLHEEYDIKLRTLKQEIVRLRQKYEIVNHNPTQNAIQNLLEHKQRAYELQHKQQMDRSHDQQQLAILCADNDNLQIIIQTLKNQLKTIIDQVTNSEQAKYQHDESMISYAMSNNTYFQDVLKDNRRLERQIKFMNHIIKREIQRNNVRKLFK